MNRYIIVLICCIGFVSCTMHSAHPLIAAIMEGDSDEVYHLLSRHNYDPHELYGYSRVTLNPESYMPALNFAVMWNDKSCVRVLLESGANPHVRDTKGYTPLYVSACRNQPSITSMLLEHGADPNELHPGRDTALHAATLGGKKDSVYRLLQAGADPHAQDMHGFTPTHIAVAYGRAEIVHRLLEFGGYNEMRAGFQDTPISIALEKEYTSVYELLSKTRRVINGEHEDATLHTPFYAKVAIGYGKYDVAQKIKEYAHFSTHERRQIEEHVCDFENAYEKRLQSIQKGKIVNTSGALTRYSQSQL